MPHRLCCSIALFLSLAASGSSAAEFDPGQVPVDAKWVIYLDLESARKTVLGRVVHQHIQQDTGTQKHLKQLRQELGIDPSSDILSITAYDNDYVEKSGTIVVRATFFDKERLIAAFVKRHPDHEVTMHGRHKIYTWQMLQGRPRAHLVSGALVGGAMILSKDTANVATALNLADGNGQSLDQDSILASRAIDGTVLLVRGIDMSRQETPFRSSLVRRATSISVNGGQAQTEMFLTATMAVDSDEAAIQGREVIEGFRAMASLHSDQDEAAQRILAGLEVVSSNKTISAEWRVSNEDVRLAAEKMLSRHRRNKKSGSPTNKESKTSDQDSSTKDP